MEFRGGDADRGSRGGDGLRVDQRNSRWRFRNTASLVFGVLFLSAVIVIAGWLFKLAWDAGIIRFG